MPGHPLELPTERLRLRIWRDDDRAAFAELNSDPAVMRDLGGPLDRETSDEKLDRYRQAFASHGYGRWAIEGPRAAEEPELLGYAGVMPAGADHPLGPHAEVGWRLRRSAWGSGFATEAARTALRDVFDRVGLLEVVTYTAPDNRRSQAVMARLGLRRDASRDFADERYGGWRGLVWVARASDVIANPGSDEPAGRPPTAR